jgi:peptide/nickel transport system substrate-binding protein
VSCIRDDGEALVGAAIIASAPDHGSAPHIRGRFDMTVQLQPRWILRTAVLALLVATVVMAVPAAVRATDTPRRGGILLAVIAAEPPSLDPHQEGTFANIQLVAPFYSTLLQFNPTNFPEIIGDLATEWKISSDGLTYTFKVRQGVRFHDGSPLTAADIKASYDKIASPPPGVVSFRKNTFTAIERVEAPDSTTVIFRLKFPSASLLDNLASPWNVIYPKKYLEQDPNYFKTHVVGSGPFKLKNYTHGSTLEGERNPDYFIKDRPYLDGFKFFVSPETSVRAAAIRSGRAHVEFRDLPGPEVEAIKKQMGDKVVVQQTPVSALWGIWINNRLKPFNDVKVRKALSLGLDRYAMSKVLYPINGLKLLGGLMRPGSGWGLSEAELQNYPGFGPDIEKNRAEARRLLTEAGYPNGLKFVLKNRNVRLPYQDFAVFAIQEWRKIGVEADHRPLETAAWFEDGQKAGNFDLIVFPPVEFMDDPDLWLSVYATGDTRNWGRMSDPRVDDLFARQTRTLNPAERKKLVKEIEKIVLENAYYLPGLWWTRNLVQSAKMKNYVAPPNYYSNQKLQDVWLSED